MSQIQGRIAGIDGLRAIAVVAVIIFHLSENVLPGGFVGVDIFFVISGYVVCGSLYHCRWNSLGDFLTQFYFRRMIRILPALLVMLISTAFVSRMFIPNSWGSASSIQTGRWALFGLSNFQLVFGTDGYFSVNSAFNPFLHTWSLGVEEQFYLIFPLLFFCQFQLQQSSIARKAAVGLVPALAVISLATCVIESSISSEKAYFLLPSRFWELATGVLLCQLHFAGRIRITNQWLSKAVTFSGLVLICISFLMATESAFPFPWAIAPVAGTLLCIAGTTQRNHDGLLGHPFMTFTGRISYSLYLWHWPVIVIMRWTTGIESTGQIATASLLSVILAFLSWNFVELPFQRLRSRQNQQITFHNIFCNRLFHFMNLSLFREFSFRSLTITTGLASLLISYSIYNSISSSLWLPQSVTMQRDLQKNPWRFTSKVPNRRLLPGRQGLQFSSRRLFIIGDSHAGAYAEIVELLRRETGTSVYLFTKAGVNLGNMIHAQTDADKSLQNLLIAEINQLARPGDVVMLVSLKVLRLATQWGSLDIENVIKYRESQGFETARNAGVADTISFVRQLHTSGLNVLIEGPKPVFRVPPYRFSDWFNRYNPAAIAGFALPRKFLEDHSGKAWQSIHEIENSCPGVFVWDPFKVLCKGDTCSAFDGDKPLFFDADHLTRYGNEILFPSLVEKLKTIWADYNKPPAETADSRLDKTGSQK